MANKRAKLKIRRSSKLTVALLAVLICVMCAMLHNMQTQLDHAKSEYELYVSRLNALQEKNDHLRQAVENSDDPELIEDIARNDLGGQFGGGAGHGKFIGAVICGHDMGQGHAGGAVQAANANHGSIFRQRSGDHQRKHHHSNQ